MDRPPPSIVAASLIGHDADPDDQSYGAPQTKYPRSRGSSFSSVDGPLTLPRLASLHELETSSTPQYSHSSASPTSSTHSVPAFGYGADDSFSYDPQPVSHRPRRNTYHHQHTIPAVGHQYPAIHHPFHHHAPPPPMMPHGYQSYPMVMVSPPSMMPPPPPLVYSMYSPNGAPPQHAGGHSNTSSTCSSPAHFLGPTVAINPMMSIAVHQQMSSPTHMTPAHSPTAAAAAAAVNHGMPNAMTMQTGSGMMHPSLSSSTFVSPSVSPGPSPSPLSASSFATSSITVTGPPPPTTNTRKRNSSLPPSSSRPQLNPDHVSKLIRDYDWLQRGKVPKQFGLSTSSSPSSSPSNTPAVSPNAAAQASAPSNSE